MKASAVIALQEVAASWVKMPGGLADVFDGKGYAWRWVNSRVGVDFTGLVLAWPTAVYEWEVVHRLDLASRIPEGGGLAQELVRNLATNLLLVDLFHKSTSQLLTVATCELPPIYRPKRDPVRPIAQEIHMSLVLDTLQNISAELPAILMGDFSLSPRSPAYALAADGNEHAAKRLGALVEGLPPTRRMRSAYFECFGAEPAFTISWKNIAVTSDYIWMGDGVAAQECLRLPDRAVEWPLPNELEGSDHVPVVAMLEVGPPTGLAPDMPEVVALAERAGGVRPRACGGDARGRATEGLAPDMPEVGDADIAGSFNRLVAKWSNVGKQGSGDALKKN
eukprot:CAMPEP_0198610030 /NCGR_PEP_ID=MMETSP1462-20131121/156692_1 /TAXON_ID=1333877 /ORGANISM="Brandtodinium nutriculum, Strain RCC3387" /LENGTH=335 /DNA_ID=CAMNT_0044341837 /DNA_START=80 /DNA_END=1088 /DNA_ORIENTATION=+